MTKNEKNYVNDVSAAKLLYVNLWLLTEAFMVLKWQCVCFCANQSNSYRNVSYRYVILIESQSKKQHMCSILSVRSLRSGICALF
jgi:hypothetical protein